jgi:hypothetical protein
MSTPTNPTSRFVIVPHKPAARFALAVLVLAWLGSIGLTAWLTARYVAPDRGELRVELKRLASALETAEERIERQRQRISVLRRSDQISRSANLELQGTIAEREEEISALRADVGFYERLVGGSAQRQGLTVHSLNLSPVGDGAWRYTVTLTQNLQKARVSAGNLALSVDGVQAGQLSTLDWPALLQDEAAAGQPFSFKYFQQLEGSVMLPEGFTPHRVRVRLRADGSSSERVFPWQSTVVAGA